VVGTKSNVLLVTNIFELTTNGTTNQHTALAVENGKKKLVPIVTATAKSDIKNSGTTNQITAPARAGTNLDAVIQVAVTPFQSTHRGQMFPNIAKTVIHGRKRIVLPVDAPKRSLSSLCGVTHLNIAIPAVN